MSIHKIALMTDSTSDIPQELRGEFGITVVPQHIIWGTNEFLDGVDIQPEDFYKRLTNDPIHPMSSQPTPQTFVKYIEEAQAAGADEVIIFCVGNQLSGTLASAKGAAELATIPVHAVDSSSASMGLGFQVLAAAKAREQGGDVQAMLAAAAAVRETLTIYITVDTLEFLHKGGRIGGAAKLFGTALQLKPMLKLDPKEGRIEPAERTRTRTRAIETMYSTFFSNLDTTRPMHICVVHAQCEDDARATIQRIEEEYHPASLRISDVTPVIGVHVGPGTIAMIGYTE